MVPTRAAVPSISRRCDGEALAGDELNGLVVFELAGADFGPLEVGEDADGLALFVGDLAHHLDEFGLLGVGAVGEVEAGDVEAGADELAEDFDGTTGRAEGGYDLRTAATFHSCKRDIVRTWVQRGIHRMRFAVFFLTAAINSGGVTIKFCCRWQF